MERIRVKISLDRLVATLEVLPPPPGAEPLTRSDLERAIRAVGVVRGLIPERLGEILALCAKGELPPAPLPIAEGLKPRPGQDGSLELRRPLSAAASAPAIVDEHERIDHRARGGVTSVAAGELIGVLRPPVPGVAGRGVDGSVLEVEPVSGPELGPGQNVDLREREDGLLDIVAAVEGMLLADDHGRLSVKDKYEVAGDVDYASGNIEARGSVVVRGTVRSSFRLTATRDVRVDASIEDAVVEVDGDLTVGLSILGGDEGHVHVGGKLAVHNAQNACIRCKGDVVITGSATGSEIECDGRLTAIEGRGRLSGGEYTALCGLEANELGSNIGAPTLIRVGMDSAGGKELAEIDAERARTAEQAKEFRVQLDGARRSATEGDVTQTRARRVRELMKDIRELANENAELEQRRRKIIERAAAWPPPEILVHGIVHSGVELQLRELRHRITTHMESVRFHYNAESRRLEVAPL